MDVKLGVSVIICCYNSAGILPVTLDYLQKQKFNKIIDWEIIIVNNASPDNTQEIAELYIKKYSLTNARVVNEQTKGLTHARNRGILESQYEFILFCDDDNFLSSTYVDLAFSIMTSNEKVGVLGGQGIFLPEHQPEKWFKGLELLNMAIGPQGDTTEDITDKKGCVYGAGMVVRKSGLNIIRENGIAQFCSDRTAGKLLSAGDTELTFIFRLLGYRLYYHQDLTFLHFVSSKKLSKDYMWGLYSGFRFTYPVTLAYVHQLNGVRYSKWDLILDHLKKITLESLRLGSSIVRTYKYRIITWRNWVSYFHFLYNTDHYYLVKKEIQDRFTSPDLIKPKFNS